MGWDDLDRALHCFHFKERETDGRQLLSLVSQRKKVPPFQKLKMKKLKIRSVQ